MNLSKTAAKQTVSAIIMALAGISIRVGSLSYRSPYDIPKAEPARPEITEPEPAPAEPETQSAPETVPETAAEEEGFSPSLSVLNTAFFFPEGADREDAGSSLAGRVLSELSIRDSEWLASIYDLSNRAPAAAAAALGLSPDSVRGLYNPADEAQRADQPDTWLLPEWSKIEMNFFDENGNRIAADSNIKEIAAMANTYFYYLDSEDEEALLSYANKLWDGSHSVRYSISGVYYCDGCLEEEVGASATAESADPATPETLAEEVTAEEETAAEVGAETATETAAAVAAGTEASTETAAAVAAGEETSAEVAVPLQAGGSGTAAEAAAPVQDSATAEAQAQESGNLPASPQETEEIGPGIELMKAAAAASKQEEPTEAVPEERIKCPGHVDLRITATIAGISSSSGSLFTIGAEEAFGPDDVFPGWNEENREAVTALVDQDWKAAYGLTVSSTYISNPLTSAEMEAYMKLLPPDTTAERKNVIRYALSSVGTVPYYWGGKASAADYDGNHFGSLVSADEKGRTMKGLDCSGWISWVYWSATGSRLPCESTDGLAGCGTAISRQELKPGDIIVRLGENAHVVMFLAWESGNKMKVIHESSGSVNNVTVSTMEASWPYYRKLID